jgi:hypothetical protein
LVWLMVAWVFVKVSPLEIYIPGSAVPVLLLKSGDVGVHLAGIAAFMLLRLDSRGGHRWTDAKLWFLWSLWVVNWLAWGASNRAGMFSAIIGIGVVILLRRRIQWHRPLAIVFSLFLLLFITDFSSPAFGDQYNQVPISSEQIISNVTSTFGKDTASSLDSTREFRLNWWTDIVGYTFNGEHFWAGKGYGINLANDDGYQVHEDTEDLRNPHNIFMTILARSGVPGLILWLLFLASFGTTLLTRAVSTEDTNPWGARYALWLLAYWLAFLFNASFDVFLEGPMGAIWFWSLIGIGLVYFTRPPPGPDPGLRVQP